MRLVIADTGPINYLIVIGQIDLLSFMFETVMLPLAVAAELKDADAPDAVRQWIDNPPAWLEIRTGELPPSDSALAALDSGEKAAIALAGALHADLLLLDERIGVPIARRKGLRVTGTLGILDLAAERGLVDFAAAIKRLENSTFYQPQALLEDLLRKHGKDVGPNG